MKKLFLLLLLTTSSSVYATTTSSHDNYFCMDIDYKGYQSVPITFDMDSSNSYSITPEQPFNGVTNITSGSNANCIDVQAGRKRSSTPVTWVKQQENNIASWWSMDYMTVSEGSTVPAGTLNFAVEGTLTINNTYNCPHTIIAQGYAIGTNNWWVFNNAQAYEDGWKNSLYCNDSHGNSYKATLRSSGDSNIILINQVISQ